MELEQEKIQKEYEQEITKCEKISQRIFLQKYISSEKMESVITYIDEIEKNSGEEASFEQMNSDDPGENNLLPGENDLP